MRSLGTSVALVMWTALVGCGIGARYHLTEEQLAEFEAAGPILPELDTRKLVEGVPSTDSYRVVAGDVLSIQGPSSLFVDVTQARVDGPADGVHLTRVSDEGRVVVPLLGGVEVRGLTFQQIEQKVISGLYPRTLRRPPSIIVRVDEYNTVPVTVVGAVENPGIVHLRSDELSLYSALSKVGGIIKAAKLVVGARRIRVLREGESRSNALALPVKGLNIPRANVPLQGGETIEVERYEPDTFTIVGLIRRPGSYAYPPEVSYNLMQALALAGGVDVIADPPYATVFRKRANGRILPATFEIVGEGLVQSSGLRIKPGDVIVLEHTVASWSRSLLEEVLRFQVNFFVDPLRDR